jgi:mannose-6-phosphate isomerase-like protein (cupin superfamily)
VVQICTPDFSAACQPDQGWTTGPWFVEDMFGQPVPLKVRRFLIDACVTARLVPPRGAEAFAYVIAGSGAVAASPPAERFALGADSVLWLGACEELSVEAGLDGLDLVLAETTGSSTDEPPEPAGPRPSDEGTRPQATGGFRWVAPPGQHWPQASGAQGGRPPGLTPRKVFEAAALPHLVSTRDTRDRLDLVTENVPVGARAIRADRIIYHPGDTAAAHYHTDCHHVFCVLAGSGLLYDGEHAHRLEAGDSALVGPGEVHWFENDTGENFSFVEFWAPPPTETVWTVPGDRCTWAPAG